MSELLLWDAPEWRCPKCGKGADGYATKDSRIPFLHRHVRVRVSDALAAKYDLKTEPLPSFGWLRTRRLGYARLDPRRLRSWWYRRWVATGRPV